MSRLLLINADDAGLHRDSDEAILRCAKEGLVRNTTVVAGGESAADFLGCASEFGLDVGLHVNLTQGRALAGPASTLTDADGNFLEPKNVVWRRAAAGELDAAEVRAEIEAQINAFRASGLEPSHVDGHNHVHLFPEVRGVLADLLPDVWFRTPIEPPFDRPHLPDLGSDFRAWSAHREGPWPRTTAFAGYAFCRLPSAEIFVGALDGAGAVTEYMVHPGQRPGSPFGSAENRAREAEAPCSRELRAELARRGFESVSFREASERCG